MLEFTPINISGRSFDCEQIVAIRKIIAESFANTLIGEILRANSRQ